MAKYIGAAKCYPFTTIPNRNIYRDVRTYSIPIYTRVYVIDCHLISVYIGAAKCYPFNTMPNKDIHRNVQTYSTPIYDRV